VEIGFWKYAWEYTMCIIDLRGMGAPGWKNRIAWEPVPDRGSILHCKASKCRGRRRGEGRQTGGLVLRCDEISDQVVMSIEYTPLYYRGGNGAQPTRQQLCTNR